MSYYMNADEILAVGAQVERNGKAFYEAAALGATDTAVASLCRELAAWEEHHVEIFEKLRRTLPELARDGGAFDPQDEVQAYVKSAADNHIFLKNLDPVALAADCKTGRDILARAMEFEKDSVVFYSALKRVVPDAQGRDALDVLIDEELRHLQILSAQRDRLDP